MNSEIAVQCRGVQKAFGNGGGKVLALRGVDLDVHYGAMTLLVGPSGCGKTTLLSVIAGLLNSTSGEVKVLGEEIEQMPGKQQILFRRNNLGFVFQQYNLLPALTAAENGAVPLLAAGIPRRKAVEEAKRLLVTLGMAERVNALPKQLSGGEQQRVALTRALIHKPRLIVCDEPTAALDADTGHTVMALLAAEAVRPERAVIVVTHDSRIFSFADTIARMDDGHILSVDSESRSERSAEFVPQERVKEEVFV
jgi:putative ABC transport system ATP-binding protein